jgi:hypothetical protein
MKREKSMDVLEQAEGLHIDLDALLRIIVHSTEVRDSATLLQLIGTEVTDIFRDDAMTGRHQANHEEHDGAHRPHAQPGTASTSQENAEASFPQDSEGTPAPLAFQVSGGDAPSPPAWTNIFMKYGLRNTGEHSALDMQRMFGSHFIFSNIPGEASERETFLLKLLSPYLHFALMRTLQTDNDSPEKPTPAFDAKP